MARLKYLSEHDNAFCDDLDPVPVILNGGSKQYDCMIRLATYKRRTLVVISGLPLSILEGSPELQAKVDEAIKYLVDYQSMLRKWSNKE